MSNILLLDTDVLCYQFAYRNTASWQWDEDDEEVSEQLQGEKALVEVDIFIDDLREKLKGDRVYLILSDPKENFRKTLAPFYKASRHSKPTLWRTIRDYIEHGDHGFPVVWKPRLEGDDVLGMMATHPKVGHKSIVVSIDKDMKTVPSRLYLFHRPDEGIHHIDRHDAERFHLSQVLTGDAVDEYKGVPGIGEKKAAAILEEHPDNRELWDAIVEIYINKGMTEDDALLQARLAYILQHGDYKGGKIKLWKPTRLGP